jgi:hypothetical protein
LIAEISKKNAAAVTRASNSSENAKKKMKMDMTPRTAKNARTSPAAPASTVPCKMQGSQQK